MGRRKIRFNLLYLILSFILAIFLWFYVMGIQDPTISETFYGVSVNMVGEDTLYQNNGFTVMSKIEDSTVNVRLSGKRSVILKVNPQDIYVEADLSRIAKAGTTSLNCTVVPPDSTLTVENLSDIRVQVNVDALITAQIPVKLEFKTELTENEIVGTTSVSPETITVRGAESELSGISFALVSPENAVTDSYYDELPFTFVDSSMEPVETAYTTTVSNRVKVSIPILEKKVLPLEVHIAEGGGLLRENVDVAISPNQITIAGEKSVVDGMNALVLKDVDLSAVTKSSSSTEDIVLDEGLVNISGVNTATVKITLLNVSEKTMIVPATQISIINAPQGFDVTVLESDLQLVIWGGNSLVSVVKNTNVNFIVDLTGVSDSGEYSLNVQVSFRDLTATPRVVGSYKVTVIVEPEKPPEAE